MVLDTLKLARRLAAAGMSPEQADHVAAAIAEGVAEQVATKSDLTAAVAELRTEMSEIRREMAELRTSVIQWIVGAILLNWVAMAGLVIALSHR